MSPGVAVSETVRPEVRRVVEGLNLIFADIGIARLRGNFQIPPDLVVKFQTIDIVELFEPSSGDETRLTIV